MEDVRFPRPRWGTRAHTFFTHTPPSRRPIWDVYRAIIVAEEPAAQFEEVERFAFYERSKRAFAVVATGETALYGNLILKKGVIGSKD